VAHLAAKQQTGIALLFTYITAIWPAYVMRHGTFLARLVFANEKACMYIQLGNRKVLTMCHEQCQCSYEHKWKDIYTEKMSHAI